MPKLRLDQRVHTLGLTGSREQARRLIMAGEVLVNGQLVDRPAAAVAEDAAIELKAKPRFVSRGGEKLDAALAYFQIEVAGLICADVGASTGGFTDCLLQRGAAKVYAIDVGHGVLDHRLRSDPRVVVMEETNARYVERLPEPTEFVTIDASFISLKVLLPVVKLWQGNSLRSGARFAREQGRELDLSAVSRPPSVVALVKPQFEAGKKDVGKGGGVIKDVEIHRRVLAEVLTFAQAQGFGINGLLASPLLGPKGNREFLVWLMTGEARGDVGELIEKALMADSR
jgi:23S rRNA (cytidine1920-2'-O)/16S rRNA (cytidine1409-2'-O)-methyltransferase